MGRQDNVCKLFDKYWIRRESRNFVQTWDSISSSARALVYHRFCDGARSYQKGLAKHQVTISIDSCFSSYTDDGNSFSNRQYMKSLQYVSELEKLGFTFSVHRFETASKLELAQALFRGHANVPEALVLILQICVDFQLNNYTLWDGVLTKMARMYMVRFSQISFHQLSINFFIFLFLYRSKSSESFYQKYQL